MLERQANVIIVAFGCSSRKADNKEFEKPPKIDVSWIICTPYTMKFADRSLLKDDIIPLTWKLLQSSTRRRRDPSISSAF